MVYASVTTGFKAGGFNAGLAPNTFPPEEITAYLVGTKNRFLDNRLQVNLDGFYWEYQNQQIPQITGVNPCPLSCNVFGVVPAAGSEIYGVEAEVVWQVTENDRLSVAANWAHGQFTEYVSRAVGPPFNQPAVNYSGSERPYTPRWKVDVTMTAPSPCPMERPSSATCTSTGRTSSCW